MIAETVFLFFNLLIFLPYYFLGEKLRLESLSARLIFAALLGLTQIILTELLLGIGEVLYRPALLGLNGAIAIGILLYLRNKISFAQVLRADLKNVRHSAGEIFAWENRILVGLTLFVLI